MELVGKDRTLGCISGAGLVEALGREPECRFVGDGCWGTTSLFLVGDDSTGRLGVVG
jgi:hypothetical protein